MLVHLGNLGIEVDRNALQTPLRAEKGVLNNSWRRRSTKREDTWYDTLHIPEYMYGLYAGACNEDSHGGPMLIVPLRPARQVYMQGAIPRV